MPEEAKGPTIVLVGSVLTLESGEQIDSRQLIKGDQWDFTLRSAIAYSEHWWETIRSWVDLILDRDEEGAWALLWAPKTLRRPKEDGSFRRVRLATALPGAASLMDFWNEDVRGIGATIDASKMSARYRILEYELRYQDLTSSRPPTVFLGIHPTRWSVGGLEPFDDVLTKWPRTVIVLPHTPITEAAASRLKAWFAGGRQKAPRGANHEKELKKYVEAQEAFRDHSPLVMNADLKVTYFLDQGTPAQAADLDAAISFLLSRYDLKVGLWDLARDPGLRESLLSPEEQKAPPSRPADVPAELAAAAAKARAKRSSEQKNKVDSLAAVHRALWPELEKRRWRIWGRDPQREAMFKPQPPGSEYHLPLGNSVLWSDLFPPVPILYYLLTFEKKQAVLRLKTPPIAFRGIPACVEERSEELERITGQQPDGEDVARFPGRGWAGDGWEELLPVVDAVVECLGRSIPPLRSAAEKAHAQGRAGRGG